MSCQVVESTWGKKPTIGGSSDTDVNDPMVKPCGRSPGAIPVTTVTPVGKWPSTVRKCPESKSVEVLGGTVGSLIAANCTLTLMPDSAPPAPGKAQLRSEMRQMRRELANRRPRSEQLWHRVMSLNEVAEADAILLFATIPGEPEVAPFRDWCEATGKKTAVPEDGLDPAWPDVVIVPGLAFTVDGDRLGQGGGWYDRYLTQVRPACTTVGVGFAEQMLSTLPTEPHDISLDYVITDKVIANKGVSSQR